MFITENSKETQAAQKFLQLKKSKLQSMKNQVQNLVAKRLRLDVEIQNLTSAIKRKSKPGAKNSSAKTLLKEAEMSEELLDNEQFAWLLEKGPEAESINKEFDSFVEEVKLQLALSSNQFKQN